MTNQQVGAWVKARREARKISVKRAHEKAGISRQTWYDLENGAHPPSFETQAGVAKALGGESGDMLHDASNPMSRQSRVYRRVDRVDPHDSDNAKHLIRTHVTILPCLHTAGVVGSSPISPTTNPLVRRPGGFVCPVTRLGLAPIHARVYGGRMTDDSDSPVFTYRRVLGAQDRIDHTAGTVQFAAGWTARLVGAFPGPDGVIVEYAHHDGR